MTRPKRYHNKKRGLGNDHSHQLDLVTIKKGSRTHPTSLGIVRRRPPQFCNILCHTKSFYITVLYV
nr:MAG TPA: hypothetical protein [Caudoviricetes sp.]